MDSDLISVNLCYRCKSIKFYTDVFICCMPNKCMGGTSLNLCTWSRFFDMAISPHVMSAPNSLHTRLNGKFPTCKIKQRLSSGTAVQKQEQSKLIFGSNGTVGESISALHMLEHGQV